MHGRIMATRMTIVFCRLLVSILDRAIARLTTSDAVEKDMGFSFSKGKSDARHVASRIHCLRMLIEKKPSKECC